SRRPTMTSRGAGSGSTFVTRALFRKAGMQISPGAHNDKSNGDGGAPEQADPRSLEPVHPNTRARLLPSRDQDSGGVILKQMVERLGYSHRPNQDALLTVLGKRSPPP